MSHNITKWQTKRIEGLSIPLALLYNSTRRDNQPQAPHLEDPEKGVWFIKWSDTIWIRGTTETDSMRLDVALMQMQDAWSEHIFFEVLLPALKQSRGQLEAVLTWAAGDSISKLTVKDGEVKEEAIDL